MEEWLSSNDSVKEMKDITLQQRGIPSEFEAFDGGHTLRTDSLKDYLEFYFAKDE